METKGWQREADVGVRRLLLRTARLLVLADLGTFTRFLAFFLMGTDRLAGLERDRE